MTTKICANCNNVFEAIGNGSQNMKYCSTCRPFSRKLKDLRRSLTRPGAHGKIPCPECGKPMCYNARWCRSCWHKKSVELKAYPQGRKHHWYKNGKPKTSEGYIRVKQSNHPFADHHGYVLEHRLIMEQHLGRILDRKEFVHHLNGIRNDNRITNLGVVTTSNHPRDTLRKLLQKRIRDLEAQLSQQKMC